MSFKLQTAFRWLGSYILSNDGVKDMPDGKWLEFHVLIKKKDKYCLSFCNPQLTLRNINPNSETDDNVKIIINEIKYD